MRRQTDRRRVPRASCNLSVVYEVRGTGDPQEGQITNIGVLGTLLKTQEGQPSVGAELLLRFQLPLSNRRVETIGKVQWTIQGRAGVEFLSLTLHAQDELWRYYAQEQEPWRRLIQEWEPPRVEPE